MIPFQVETIEGFEVVRDDRVPGGTKARVLAPLLAERSAAEFVYASPAYGYAQIALAHAAAASGKRATVFVAKRGKPHPRTLQAKAAGARILQVEHGYLSHVSAKARAYAAARTGVELLPFGLDEPAFRERLTDMVAGALGHLRPPEVWTAAGSGTLSRALQAVWPEAAFFAVQVGQPPSVGRAQLLMAPEAFERDAKAPPPFPSCSNYDAKVWAFMRAQAKPGALFWNVGA